MQSFLPGIKFYLEDGGYTFLRNADKLLSDYTTSQPKIRRITEFTTASRLYGHKMEKHEMAQVMERMLARIDANTKTMQENQEKEDANTKTVLEKMTGKMDANQAKADKTLKETLTKMEAERKSDLENLKSMIERMTNVNQAKTGAKLKEFTETIEKTQTELQTAEVSLDARARKLEEDLTETKNKLQARLEAVETRTVRGTTPVTGNSTVQPPTFNGNTTWSVFRRQFEIVAEHNRWSDREKSTYLITALKGRAADILYGIPTCTT
jgi:hypothetical protein